MSQAKAPGSGTEAWLRHAHARFVAANLTASTISGRAFSGLCPECLEDVVVQADDAGTLRMTCSGRCSSAVVATALAERTQRAVADHPGALTVYTPGRIAAALRERGASPYTFSFERLWDQIEAFGFDRHQRIDGRPLDTLVIQCLGPEWKFGAEMTHEAQHPGEYLPKSWGAVA